MNPKKLLVYVIIALSIVFFVYIVPPETEKRPVWNPQKREIIKLELGGNWSEAINSVAGKCVYFEYPVEFVTVQYKTNRDSSWKFYNSKEWKESDVFAWRFRAKRTSGWVFYEHRPPGLCGSNVGVLRGVGEDIRIKIVLSKNAWSHGVDVKRKECIKWWMERGKGFKVQFKHGKYDDWKAWPGQKEKYRGWESLVSWRFKPTVAGGWVEYSLRPAGQCRD